MKFVEQRKFDLCNAVLMHDVSKVTALLAFGAPVDFSIPENWKYRMHGGYNRMPAPAWGDLPLIHMVAMIAYDTVILDAIINAGGNVLVTYDLSGNSGGYETSGSILHNTLNLHTNLPVFKRLVEAGADVNAKNQKGISVVTTLLTTEAFNRFTRSQGYQCEARDEKISILKLLVANGATLNATDTAMMLKLVASKPITDSDIELLQLCLDKNLTFTITNGGNILHYLAGNLVVDSSAKKSLVGQAVNSGISLNAQDQQGRTPLHIAAQNACISVMNILLEQIDATGKIQVDVNLADYNGITPLHLAAKTSTACVNKLLAHNADKDAIDHDGATVVHYAASTDQQTLEILLHHGSNPDVPDNNGTTPLMIALSSAMLTNASVLLNAGANIWAKTHEHKTTLDFALSQPHTLTYVQAEMTRQQHELTVNTQQKLTLS